MGIFLGIVLILVVIYIICLALEDGDFVEAGSAFLQFLFIVILMAIVSGVLTLGILLIFGKIKI